MTRDDIIRMAHEAGNLFVTQFGVASATPEWLERFAALVADAKYAEHQQTLALQQRSYEREIQLEVEAEREACAKVCEEMRPSKSEFDQRYYNGCTDSAKAIRARTP